MRIQYHRLLMKEFGLGIHLVLVTILQCSNIDLRRLFLVGVDSKQVLYRGEIQMFSEMFEAIHVHT